MKLRTIQCLLSLDRISILPGPSEILVLKIDPLIMHECPTKAIPSLIIRQNQRSSRLQELSPVMFTLMKSTEPFLDEYYLTNLEATIKEAGFVNVQTILTDPRHRTVTATVPPYFNNKLIILLKSTVVTTPNGTQ
ncbi:hypothetical protein POM88_023023 [Heracleum sosnowskyi]|uniref:Uncharacterized protein n=1 Tax=Heracleum sosnowskyi TaxID=360622 RepID=A0AAD8IIP7_9APIA|nr:hypothetical protein POM88_023023 [Heracleum sosnowskyi]